jgi:hypothetical protein
MGLLGAGCSEPISNNVGHPNLLKVALIVADGPTWCNDSRLNELTLKRVKDPSERRVHRNTESDECSRLGPNVRHNNTMNTEIVIGSRMES